MIRRHSNLAYLYAVEVFSGLSRGSFLVCIGWVTLVVTDEVAKVGQIFVIGWLTHTFAAPLLGALVDRWNRKWLALWAHLGIGAGMIAAGGAIERVDAGAGEMLLFGLAVLIFALRLLYQLCHDGLIKGNVGDELFVSTIARCRTIHMVGTIVGTVAAGVVLEDQGVFAGFALSGTMSLLLLAVILFVQGVTVHEGSMGFSGFLLDLSLGFRLLVRDPALRSMALLAAATLPVGQLSNAVLSSYIRDDLGYGSSVFGVVDAAWPAGGMVAAAMMSIRLSGLSGRHIVYLFAVAAGFATIALGTSSSIPVLIVVHGAMGLFVWFCHILVDARTLRLFPDEQIGRAKSVIHMAYGLSAVTMCLSPTFITLASSGRYFVYWGVLSVISCVVLGALAISGSRKMGCAGEAGK